MKVLLVVPRLNIGGAESYVFTLAKGLKDKGIEIVLVSGGGYLANRLEKEGFKHYYCPIRLNRYLASRLLAYIIKKEKITLIHANSTAAAYPVSIACKNLHVPWIMTSHGFFYTKAAKYVNSANHVICVSNFLKEHLIEHAQLNSNTLTTIYNGIDLDHFKSSGAEKNVRKNWNLDDKDFLVGLVGRMANVNWKGHYDIIQAMANQPKDTPWKLLVIGKGRAAWRIRLKAFLSGASHRIKFIGHQTDMPKIISACDAMVLPSQLETFGLVLAEGMALGKPVIAYGVGGTPEVVDHGKSGFLTPPGKADEMVSLVDRLYKDRDLCQQLGKNGIKRVQTLFSSDIMVDQTIALYKKVLGYEVNPPCS